MDRIGSSTYQHQDGEQKKLINVEFSAVPPPALQRASSAGDMHHGHTASQRSFRRFRDGYHSAGEYDSADEDGAVFAKKVKDKQNKQEVPLMTGRQRRRVAARGKHGDFSAHRRKRRLYFACVSSDIDVQDLFDYLTGAGGSYQGWTYKIYDRVLWMFKPGSNATGDIVDRADSHYRRQQRAEGSGAATDHVPTAELNHDQEIYNVGVEMSQTSHCIFEPGAQEVFVFEFGATVMWGFARNEEANMLKTIRMFATKGVVGDLEFEDGEDDLGFIYRNTWVGSSEQGQEQGKGRASSPPSAADYYNSLHSTGGGEIEESELCVGSPGTDDGGDNANVLALRQLRHHQSEDREAVPASSVATAAAAAAAGVAAADTAIVVDSVVTPNTVQSDITIANDLLVLPELSTPKQRMSVSYAIAQSSVLSVFESRVEKKILAYKYIPETLAKCGDIHISQRSLGIMVGDIFAIQHDVNLRSEILDMPDFFWNEEDKYVDAYRTLHEYLEMSERASVLNKRLLLMRELLQVCQRLQEGTHSTELEWIVIWLIIISIVLDGVAAIY